MTVSALWFGCLLRSHAFEVRSDGVVDESSLCGVDIDDCADEPVRAMEEFDACPACQACLRVLEPGHERRM